MYYLRFNLLFLNPFLLFYIYQKCNKFIVKLNLIIIINPFKLFKYHFHQSIYIKIQEIMLLFIILHLLP